MSKKTLRKLCWGICLLMSCAAGAFAQGGPPPGGGGGRQGGQGGMGGPGWPGGPNGQGNPNGQGGPHGEGSPQGRGVSQPHNALQFGPVGRWWDDRTVTRAVGLSNVQQRKMDGIFNANKPAILDSYKAFLKAQANLQTVNSDPKADKARLFAAIDAVTQARGALQKATSAMLLEIRQQMEPAQIEKLEKLQ